MTDSQLGPKPRYNFENTKILLVDPAAHGLEILSHIFTGYGARPPIRAANADEARSIVKKCDVDLIVCEASLDSDMDGYDFVRWLRHSKIEPNNFTSVVIVTGHTPKSVVEKARDSGAHFIVVKPLTPRVMIDRVIWIARDKRPFIECGSYLGPDRRFHAIGMPIDSDGRRSSDLSLEVGEAVEPNLSQSDIDAMLQPQRIKA